MIRTEQHTAAWPLIDFPFYVNGKRTTDMAVGQCYCASQEI